MASCVQKFNFTCSNARSFVKRGQPKLQIPTYSSIKCMGISRKSVVDNYIFNCWECVSCFLERPSHYNLISKLTDKLVAIESTSSWFQFPQKQIALFLYSMVPTLRCQVGCLNWYPLEEMWRAIATNLRAKTHATQMREIGGQGEGGGIMQT